MRGALHWLKALKWPMPRIRISHRIDIEHRYFVNGEECSEAEYRRIKEHHKSAYADLDRSLEQTIEELRQMAKR